MDKIGEAILVALFVIGFMALTGGIALISGIVAAFASGVVKTVALWICGISAALFSIPLIVAAFHTAKEEAEVARRDREYRAERTHLILAVENRDFEKIEKLIKKGVDVNEIKNGKSALSVACSYDGLRMSDEGEAQYDKIISILLEAGADANLFVTEPKFLECFSWKKIPPLALAIGNWRNGAVKILIEKGVFIDSYNREESTFKPFQFALFTHNYEAARILLEAGAKTGYYVYGYHYGYEEEIEKITLVMELFDGYESEYNISDKVYILEKLLETIAITDKDDYGRTALHFSLCDTDWTEYKASLVKMALDAGADINALDDKGRTPLIVGVEHIIGVDEIADAVTFLVSHGADITVKNKEGKTALDIFLKKEPERPEKDYYNATMANYDKIIDLLTVKEISSMTEAKKGANTNVLDVAAKIASAERAHKAKIDFQDDW